MGYENGKIYIIRCNETGEHYVGSTTQRLSDRMYTHRSQARSDGKHTASKDIILRGNYEAFIYELYPCETKEQLRAREEYHRMNIVNCVNHLRAYLTEEEKKAYKAKWFKDNYIPNPRTLLTEEEEKEKKKQHYQENKEYYQKNRDEHKDRQKEMARKHREDNKEEYLKREAERRQLVSSTPELAEKQKEYKREYYLKNKDVIRAKQKESYARKKTEQI